MVEYASSAPSLENPAAKTILTATTKHVVAKGRNVAAKKWSKKTEENYTMKICIPVEKVDGLKSLVHFHFGSAPNFVIYDTATKELTSFDNSGNAHQEGHCNPMAQFANHPIDAMIVSNIGGRALMKLNAGGVKVYASEAETNISQVIQAFESGTLKEIAPDQTCIHHDHGGCH